MTCAEFPLVSGQLSVVGISPPPSCSHGAPPEDPHTQLHHLQPPTFTRHEQWISQVQLHREDPPVPGETRSSNYWGSKPHPAPPSTPVFLLSLLPARTLIPEDQPGLPVRRLQANLPQVSSQPDHSPAVTIPFVITAFLSSHCLFSASPSFWFPSQPHSFSRAATPFSPRPEKDREATGVDLICTYRPDPTGSGLDRERLYWELSQLTHGITQLGNYPLDQGSLFVNGELQPSVQSCTAEPTFYPPRTP